MDRVSDFFFLIIVMPLLVVSSVNIIVKSWRNLKHGERFYPFVVRARLWLFDKIYGLDKMEEYKNQFDATRKWELRAIVGIAYGIFSIIVYIFLSYILVIMIWY